MKLEAIRSPRLAGLPALLCLALAPAGCGVPGRAPPVHMERAPMPIPPVLRVRGEAVYFEKVRMPPGSLLQVRMRDGTGVVATQTSQVGSGPYVFSIDVARPLLQHAQCCTLEITLSMPDGSPRFASAPDLQLDLAPRTADLDTGRVRLYHLAP